jgi:hypothetical protein
MLARDRSRRGAVQRRHTDMHKKAKRKSPSPQSVPADASIPFVRPDDVHLQHLYHSAPTGTPIRLLSHYPMSLVPLTPHSP